VVDSAGRPHAATSLLKAADQALLAAKQLGRNRVLSAAAAAAA
jgi:PleD family two-component response regulator